jgi:hypothetical protein
VASAAQADAGRVLVLGGHRGFGTVLAAAFEHAGWTTLRAGRKPDRRPDRGSDFRHVDLAEPETLEKVLGEADIVVSAVRDDRLTAERMVLERGGVLMNVSATPAAAARRLRNESAQARGTVLTNAGVAPGLTNLVAADLLARWPDADEVELVFTASAGGSSPAGSGFVHRGVTAARRHRTAVIALPEPFGRRRCVGFAEPDGGWLGDIVHGRMVSPYLSIREQSVQGLLLALNAARLVGRVPRAAFAVARSHDPESEPVSHWVAVRRGGEYLAARTLRFRGEMRGAASAALLYARALAEHASSTPLGVLAPEDFFTLAEFESALGQAGITVIDEK